MNAVLHARGSTNKYREMFVSICLLCVRMKQKKRESILQWMDVWLDFVVCIVYTCACALYEYEYDCLFYGNVMRFVIILYIFDWFE